MNERISLTMIVRNEAVQLANCLDSVKNDVDELVIVDTGSTDDTISIARGYTSKVYSFPWNHDFSAARNFAIEHASGEWILALDADEEIQFQGPASLHALLDKENDEEAFLLPLLNPVSDSTGEYNTFYVLRLFRNNGSYQYVGKIHEQVTLPDPQKVGLAKDLILKHQSLPLKIRHQKRTRNLTLLKKAAQEDPHNPFLHYYLGVEWLMLGKPGSALPFLQKAYTRLSDDNLLFRAPALKYLILSFRALGRLDEALSLCLAASLDYPPYTDIFYLGGLLFEEKEEYPIALKWFAHAITCGNPPALFNHLTGSESFLAFYHSGFCYERIGKNSEAREAYETALKLNPSYPYPLYSLFLSLLLEKGSSLSYQHLEDCGFLNDLPLCLISADLFFRADHVEQAYHCLETHKNGFLEDERFSFYYSKYCLYSGRVHEGLNGLRQITENHSFYQDSQKLLIVALILIGDFQGARRLAISLWKKPLTRTEAHIFLSILRFMQKGELPLPLLKVREKEILNPTLELLADCKRYRSHDFFLNPLVATYCLALESMIKSSEKGFHQLLDDFEQRLLELKNRFGATFGNSGMGQ